MPIRSFLDLGVYQRSYKASIVVNKEIVPKLPASPDSRRTSHSYILLSIPLALSVPGYGSVTPPGVPNVSISPIIQTGVSFLFVAAIILTLFFLIYGGIRWIVSGGNKEKVAQARQTLTYAVIGLIIVLLSFFIINTIFGLFGLEFVGPPVYNPDCGLGRDC